MRVRIFFAFAALLTASGCGLTPMQKVGVVLTVVGTGLVLAHQQDSGKPVMPEASGKNSCYPGHPCLPPGGK